MIAVIVIVAILLASLLAISLLRRQGPSAQDSLPERNPNWWQADGGHHGKEDWDQGTFG